MPLVNVRVVDTLVLDTPVDGNDQEAEWQLFFVAEPGTAQEVELFEYVDSTVLPGDLALHNDRADTVDTGNDFLDIRVFGFEFDDGILDQGTPLPAVDLSIDVGASPSGFQIIPVPPAGNPEGFRYDFILEWA